MNNDLLNFDKLPDSSALTGTRKLTIQKCEMIIAKTTGATMLQFSYTIDDTNTKFNFDNCPCFDKDMNPIAFGQAKLKKILKATNTIPTSNFTLKMLPPILIGKSFQADLVLGKSGKYLEIASIDSIVPLDTKITPQTFNEPEQDNNPKEAFPDIVVTSDPDF